MGTTLSTALQIVLADIPDKPTPPPTVDTTQTSVKRITVDFPNANPDDGGSPILLYEL